MSDRSDRIVSINDQALEMIMRDVLDGLFELSLESSFSAHGGDLEILEVRPAGQPLDHSGNRHSDGTKADIIEFPSLKQACC